MGLAVVHCSLLCMYIVHVYVSPPSFLSPFSLAHPFSDSEMAQKDALILKVGHQLLQSNYNIYTYMYIDVASKC